MKTHKDCLNKKCTHREYFAQFVTPHIMDRVLSNIPLGALQSSSREHFNDIPLARWDGINLSTITSLRAQLKDAEDSFSLSVNTCILKEAARQLIESEWLYYTVTFDDGYTLSTQMHARKKDVEEYYIGKDFEKWDETIHRAIGVSFP